MKTKDLIIQELEQIPETRLNEILEFIYSLKQTISITEKQYKPIWEVADDIIKDIPQEVFDELPQDGAENYDNYRMKDLPDTKTLLKLLQAAKEAEEKAKELYEMGVKFC